MVVVRNTLLAVAISAAAALPNPSNAQGRPYELDWVESSDGEYSAGGRMIPWDKTDTAYHPRIVNHLTVGRVWRCIVRIPTGQMSFDTYLGPGEMSPHMSNRRIFVPNDDTDKVTVRCATINR